MRNTWTIAWSTYNDTARRPLYYILLAVMGLLIFVSNFLALFTFNLETNIVREVGIASIALWGFLIIAILSPIEVTQELEDRTAITLLTKPVTRSAFLLGKYFGLMIAAFLGMLVLSCVLFYTLWWMSRGTLIGPDPDAASLLFAFGGAGLAAAIAGSIVSAKLGDESARGRAVHRAAFALYAAASVALVAGGVLSDGDRGAADLAWQSGALQDRTVWSSVQAFLRESGIIVVQGFLLSFLQVVVLGAVCVSLAAFVPAAVSVSGTALLYMLGNLSTYLVAGAEQSGHAWVRGLGRAAYYLLPNLGYYNLQTHFSEGSIISLPYLAMAGAHAAMYAAIVFLVSCALFERGEIR